MLIRQQRGADRLLAGRAVEIWAFGAFLRHARRCCQALPGQQKRLAGLKRLRQHMLSEKHHIRRTVVKVTGAAPIP